MLNIFFIFDYLTVILPRRLLSTATARYSTHPLCRLLSTTALNPLRRLRSTSALQELRSLKVSEIGTIRKLGCGFLFAFYSNWRYSDLWVENRKIIIPHTHLAPSQGGDPVGISPRYLILIKLEWLGYRVVKKLWQYVKPFPWNTERDGQTDGQTNRQMDRIAISISRISLLARDKKWFHFWGPP